MDGKLVLGFLNYLMLGLIFIFGLISLVVKDQKKKLSFLFFMLFSSGILSYLFFAKISFILPAIILLFFYLAVFLMVGGQEYFGFGKPVIKAGRQILKKQEPEKIKLRVIVNLLISLFLCIGAGVLFYYFNRDFYQGLILVETFKTADMSQIVSNMGINYIPVILLLICGISSAFFYFISILDKRGDVN
jgi:hypothetical protein